MGRFEKEKNVMAGARLRLKYMSAVPKNSPVEQVAVSSSHMEEVDKAIREKVRQNEAERIASIEVAGRYTVR